MTPALSQTPVAVILAARIRSNGPITFAEYMRECLYHPQHGYYCKPESQRFADYYTSVDVHPIFGRLLARQFAEMWELLGRPVPFTLVEVGAGVGRLAAHILDFAARVLPEFHSATEYVAVEQSEARRACHAPALTAHIAAGRVRSAGERPRQVEAGCIFSNELLDALPVHRVVLEGGTLCEIYVALDGERFIEQRGPLSDPFLADYFARLLRIELREGQQAEVCIQACDWIEDAGSALGRGFILTVDYGHEARELYDERHMRGTLLAYHKHRAGEDWFAAPGEQDLTAHVNFSALDAAGRTSGLVRTGLVSQSHFLMALGRANEFADLYEPGQTETERVQARLLLKNLIYPEGMGETFQVLIQHKDVDQPPRLTGLQPL